MANAVTIGRLPLLVVCLFALYFGGTGGRTAAFFLVIVVVGLDGIDGYIARRRKETSALGGVLDIAIDRVVENVFWITFVDLNLVPVWVSLIVVGRGILTDAVRGYALAKGFSAFKMMRSKWGRRLVSGRFMRALYGAAKIFIFCYLVAIYALQAMWAGTPSARWLDPMRSAGLVVATFVVVLCLVRGVPVLIEGRHFFGPEGSETAAV